MILTGHSLGGGLASAAAVHSVIDTDTFNAAGLSLTTVTRGEVGAQLAIITANYHLAPTYINAFYVNGEILNYIQSSIPGLPDAIGTHVKLTNPYVDPNDDLANGNGFLWLLSRYKLHKIRSVLYSCSRIKRLAGTHTAILSENHAN